MARITLNNNRAPARAGTANNNRARRKYRKSDSRTARGNTNEERIEGRKRGLARSRGPMKEEGRQTVQEHYTTGEKTRSRERYENQSASIRCRRRRLRRRAISIRKSFRRGFRWSVRPRGAGCAEICKSGERRGDSRRRTEYDKIVPRWRGALFCREDRKKKQRFNEFSGVAELLTDVERRCVLPRIKCNSYFVYEGEN